MRKLTFPFTFGIGSGATFLIVVIFGYILLPYVINNKIKTNLTLKPGNDARALYTNLPFGLDFKVYIFNITNPRDVANGDSPVVDEIGPYYFEEWKEKVRLEDNEENDELTYHQRITWKFRKHLSGRGLTGEEIVTIPHPLIVAISILVARERPAMLSLADKALNAVFDNPTTPFLTAPVMDILFRGVIINCTVTDFSAKNLCNQLRTEAKDLEHVTDNIFKFSIFGMKNGTIDKHSITVKRGIVNSHDLGLVVAVDGAKEMSIWPTKECNQFIGTDSTIFPPFLTKEEGMAAFAPELCRSLVATFVEETDYRGITVNTYDATFGDMSKDKALECYCPANASCWKQGLHDLTKCVGAPLVASLPHFYNCDPSYIRGVRGLHPNKYEHGIVIHFESMTGTPVLGKKRLQFSLPFMPIEKVAVMKNVPNTLVPLLWVEEGANLPEEYALQLVEVFKIFTIIKNVKLTVLIISVIGMGITALLYYKNRNIVSITKIEEIGKTDRHKNGISTISHDPQRNVLPGVRE